MQMSRSRKRKKEREREREKERARESLYNIAKSHPSIFTIMTNN